MTPVDGRRLDAIAERLRAEHPHLDPLELDADALRALAIESGALGLDDDDTVVVALAWEQLIP